jgi:hypothetical protein
MALAEKELFFLRKESGYLKIDNADLFYAVATTVYEPMTWQWRVFIPKGRRFQWKAACGDIPAESIPKHAESLCITKGSDREMIVNIALRQDKDNKWFLYLKNRVYIYGNEGLRAGWGGTSSISIPDSIMNLFTQTPIGYSDNCIGVSGAETRKPNEPIVFLRHLIGKSIPTGGSESMNDPMRGIMVWLEEVK